MGAIWPKLPASFQRQLLVLGGSAPKPPKDGARETTADPEEAPESSMFKPMMFLGGGVAVALVIALLSGPRDSAQPGPAPGVQRIDVQAAPAGSEIFIDGTPCGFGSCDADLETGMHEVSARLLGYAPARQTVAVESGQAPQSVRLALEPLSPELDLTTDLGTGEVLLDGEVVASVDEGAVQIDALPFGEHELRFQSSGLSMTLAYRAEPGEPLVLTQPVETSELKAAVAVGLSDRIRLHAGAAAAEVAIDDGENQPVPEDGYSVEGLAVGRHEAVFSDGSSVGFEIGMRPVLVASLTSDRNVGGLQIVTGVDDAVVSINGRPYRRKTARGRLLVYLRPGSYKIGAAKPGFLSSGEQAVRIAKGRRTTLELPSKSRAANRDSLDSGRRARLSGLHRR